MSFKQTVKKVTVIEDFLKSLTTIIQFSQVTFEPHWFFKPACAIRKIQRNYLYHIIHTFS